MRRARAASTRSQTRGQIVDAGSISEWPADAADRAVPGYWDGDLNCAAKNSYVPTMVERQSRFVMLVRVPGKDRASVVKALTRKVRTLLTGLMRSLTWECGLELAQHKKFTIDTAIAVYFCDPNSPWQRGSDENTNGLIRQYLPKGSDLSPYGPAQLNAIAMPLNTRPVKTLGFKTPAVILAAHIALTD